MAGGGKSWLFAGFLVLGTSGCLFGKSLLASPAEYADFRATWASHTVEDRLRAQQRYLRKYPKGHYRREVTVRHTSEEDSFYDKQRRTEAGLEWYLRVLPNGAHANKAMHEAGSLAARADEAKAARLLVIANGQARRLARAAHTRSRSLRNFNIWLKAAAKERNFGKPPWGIQMPLVLSLRAQPNPGRCYESLCRRTVLETFVVPKAGGGLEKRAAIAELVLRLESGGVVGVEIRGPELFSRLWEAKQGRPINSDKLMARANAVAYVQSKVEKVLSYPYLEARCEAPSDMNAIFVRACEGYRLRILVGAAPGDDDAIVFERYVPPASK